uniref:Retrovirus-related Pol polyprotein from transposon TNT 1-94 n=1 Tax=Cajanus cajan TaxID=3821 RepID=A0A151SUN7_CAJCA|nr:Retrovirus-related Pol polyprotein from transposon TNT 1-94 [Cajanus cajan]
MGNGSGLNISHSGTLLLNDLSLSNTLCVPSMQQKILSVSQRTKQTNSAVVLLPNSFHVKNLQTGQTTHKGSCVDELYLWPTNSPSVHSVRTDSFASWHYRLGHPSSSIFTFIQQHFSLGSNKFQQSDCNSCQISKSHKLPFHESTLKSSYPLEIIFSDVWTSPVLSIDGLRYYCMFVDHFTRYIWLYPIKRKSDVQTLFPKFKSLFENFFHHNIKILYTDNGGEYTTPPHTPEHNGIFERRNRHIAETGLSLLHHSGLSLTYWPHAMTIAAYLINSPDYHKLKCFGCLCFPWIKPYANHKLAPKSAMCVFVGYSADQHAYLCLDPTTGRIYTSRHVNTTLNPPAEVSTAPSSSSLTNSPTPAPPSTGHSEFPPSPPTSTPSPQCSMPPSQPAVNPHRRPQPDGGGIITRSKNNIVKPLKKLNLHVQPFLPLEPNTITQALRDPDWRSTMQAEFDALHHNNTWELVNRSSAQNLVGCKWVFRIKRHLDGSIDRYKARLVAKGFHQRPGWDYTETFNLVVKPVTIRIVLTLVAFNTNKLAQFMQHPRTAHWSALKRVLRYLAGSCDKGIFISATAPLTLHAYSDADWASDKDDYISTTGYLLYLGSTPISWSSRKQRSVARSSAEAE